MGCEINIMLAKIVFQENGINYYNYSVVLHNFKPGRLLLLILVHSYISNVTTSTTDEALGNSIGSKNDEYRLQYAAQMLSYMNLSVDPCEDFYEYACGNWKNVIKERQTEQKRVNVLDIEYKLAKVVESMLRKDSHEIVPEYAEQFELVKKFFNQCLKTKLYPMRKAPEYLRIIREIGGFPALDPKWDASQFSWLKMSAHMNRYGLESLIKEEIISEYPFMPYFPLPSLGFGVELHHDNMDKPVSRPYLMNKKRMQKILALYGIDKHRINIIIEDIFEFIKIILNLMAHFEEDESKCEELSETLNDDLEEDVIYQQWLAYFDIVWQGKFHTLTADNRPCLYFYKELNRIIERHKEATANYLSLKFLYHMDAHLQHSKYQKNYCIRTVKSDFNFLFDHIFMKVRMC